MEKVPALEYGRGAGRRGLQGGQVSQLIVKDTGSDQETVLLETDMLIESPNWTPDAQWIIVNGGGKLYRLATDGSTGLMVIPTGSVDDINNDHILSPEGETLYFSAGGHLFSVPVTGGDPFRISNVHASEYSYWLHGVSPDNKTLAYVSVEPEGEDPRGRRNLVTIPVAGGQDTPLSQGVVPFDGPEYSPDGAWIYYNSEEAAALPGHAQLFRMKPDGTGRQQLTFDDRVNWFPHLSPDGSVLVYISYEPGTVSHPADMNVELRLMEADGGPPRTICTLFGGQGTLNTNSWAPDSTRFAYVAYPAASP